MKIHFLGAGALGCAIGGTLAAAGSEVTLIDPFQAHVDAIERDGLRLRGGRDEPERTVRWFGQWEGDAAPGRTVRVQMAYEDGAPWSDLRVAGRTDTGHRHRGTGARGIRDGTVTRGGPVRESGAGNEHTRYRRHHDKSRPTTASATLLSTALRSHAPLRFRCSVQRPSRRRSLDPSEGRGSNFRKT